MPKQLKDGLAVAAQLVSILTMLGVAGLLVQVGEYKANFENLCERVTDLRYLFDAYAAENKNDHEKINEKLMETRERVARTARQAK